MASTSRRSFLIKALIGGAITVGLVLFLLRYVQLDKLGQMLANPDWYYMAQGFALWLLLYLVRTVRFVLLAPRTPYLTMLCIASVHNFLLRLLPMRTGDLSYAFLLRRAGTAGLGQGLLGLLLLRLLDATTVVVLFGVALVMHQGSYQWDRWLGVGVAGGAAVLFIAVVLNLGRMLNLGLAMASWLARTTGLAARPRVEATLARIADAVASFAETSPWVILQVSGVTVVVWLLTFGAFFSIMRAFSMPVGFSQTVLGATAGVVVGFLPVGGLGSFGTLEAGWTAGFTAVGLQLEDAALSGFGVSLTTFAYASLMGLLGWIGLSRVSQRSE